MQLAAEEYELDAQEQLLEEGQMERRGGEVAQKAETVRGEGHLASCTPRPLCTVYCEAVRGEGHLAPCTPRPLCTVYCEAGESGVKL